MKQIPCTGLVKITTRNGKTSLTIILLHHIQYLNTHLCTASEPLVWILNVFILEKNGSNCVAFSAFTIMYSTETFYWFGDNNYTEWEELFNLYQEPPYQLPKHTGAYSFGIAGEDITFAIIFASYVAGTFFSKLTFNRSFCILNLHSEFNCQLLLQLYGINYGPFCLKTYFFTQGLELVYRFIFTVQASAR